MHRNKTSAFTSVAVMLNLTVHHLGKQVLTLIQSKRLSHQLPCKIKLDNRVSLCHAHTHIQQMLIHVCILPANNPTVGCYKPDIQGFCSHENRGNVLELEMCLYPKGFGKVMEN